jgi:hypothetical protein
VRGNPITPRRLAIAGVCLLSFALCLGLAWWQWERFESATGSWQNLGYVLQWPLFGLLPEPPRPRAPEARPAVNRVPRQDEPDDELAAYNRFLAELNARDQQERR